MLDLGTLPGDFLSVAYSINNLGQVVGTSCDVNFNCRAFLWQNGSMVDLNNLILPTSLYLVSANDLNDYSEIVGQAFDQRAGSLPAFMATPISAGSSQSDLQVGAPIELPASIRQRLQQQRGLKSLGLRW
jgi:probable HAF family extracellular repeat protein